MKRFFSKLRGNRTSSSEKTRLINPDAKNLEDYLCDQVATVKEHYNNHRYKEIEGNIEAVNLMLYSEDFNMKFYEFFWQIQAIHACSLYRLKKFKQAAKKFKGLSYEFSNTKIDCEKNDFISFQFAARELFCRFLEKKKIEKSISECVVKTDRIIQKLKHNYYALANIEYNHFKLCIYAEPKKGEKILNRLDSLLKKATDACKTICPLNDLSTKHLEVAEKLAKLEYALATESFIVKGFESAYKYCWNACKHSNNPLYFFMLTYISFAQEKYAQAKEEFSEAVKVYNDHFNRAVDYHLTPENRAFIEELIPNLIDAIPKESAIKGFHYSPMQSEKKFSFKEEIDLIFPDSFIKPVDLYGLSSDASQYGWKEIDEVKEAEELYD